MALKRWEREEQLRLRGVAMMDQGFSPTQIARELGVAHVTVYGWKFGGQGKGASNQPTGRKPALARKQRRQLEKILERGAVRYGFPTEVWTGKRIAQVIRERFGVDYHFKSILYLLRLLGWSWQKPQKKALERDDEAVAHWVRYRWPRIKKSSGAGRDDDFRG